MEEAVSFSIMRSWRVWGKDGSGFIVYVSCVEEFIKLISGFSIVGYVGADVVESPETTGEGDVRGVCEVCGAED